jgi:hypothetical protein
VRSLPISAPCWLVIAGVAKTEYKKGRWSNMAIKQDDFTIQHPEHLHKQCDTGTRTECALERANELKERIENYLAEKDKICTGFDLIDEYATARSE